MAQNNSINVVNLDFDQIKESLKTYLQNQSVLKDYNFDGSVLNTLLDVLAYNTHYQAFYSNMVANEMFLDSALVRSSIVSHAKQLGYLPSSTRAAKGLVNVNLTAPATSDTYIARGTEFTGINPAGTRYKFVNLETVFADAGSSTIGPFDLYEGTIRRITYIYNRDTKIGSFLIIPNDKADISTIKVNVYKSITDTTGIDDVWNYGADYLTLEPTSKVYFLQERDAGIYELYFGDGILGEQPETGNVVSIEYLETNGNDGNGVESFTKSDSAISSIEFQTSGDFTFGGANRETTGSIKYNAPKFYQTGNRAVTENDYAALVYKKYPNVASVNVYGGETVVPPQYGTVFIAIRPSSGGVLTTSEKINLENDIRSNNSIVTITPKVVDPDYIDLVLDTTVIYNPSTLSISPGVLKTLAISYIYGYSAVNVEQFGRNFYYSKMAEGINNIHKSVLGVYSKIKMRKSSDVSTIRASRSFSFNFGNGIYHPHDGHVFVVTSSTFSHNDVSENLQFDCSIQDDGFGSLNVVRQDPDNADEYLLVYPSIGVVDYSAGTVTLNSKFQPNSRTIETTAFPIIITVEPETTNIYANENQILRISPSYTDSVRVSVVSETSAEALAVVR
jgi:hypothetical protein